MKKPAKQALINYFNGNSPADEQEAIEAYLALGTDAVYVELCLKEAMTSSAADALPLSPAEREQAWLKFKTKTSNQLIRSIVKTKRNWISYAAAVTVFLLSATIILHYSYSPGFLRSAVVYQRIKAGYGKIAQITLTDSSHLSLFPGTIIDIPSDFNAVNRKVFLNGRAYFEVAHNRKKPFYVRTVAVNTRVLGTSFEVNATTNNEAASVILRTGRVRISNQQHNVAVLHPGQKFIYHRFTGKYSTERVQPDKLLSWLNGELSFDQTSFAEICRELEKWYHITIKVQNKQLLSKKITADFKGQSSAQVLSILSATAGFSYKTTNHIIHIY